MSENRNLILDFDWDVDIKNAYDPPAKHTSMNPSKYIDNGEIPWGMILNTEPLVQADPQDILSLKKGTMSQVGYHANAMIWMHTLDKYIWQYALLMSTVKLKEGTRTSVKVDLPNEIRKKLDQYMSELNSEKVKGLPVDLRYVRYIFEAERHNYRGTGYRIPRIGSPFYLNQLWRGLDAGGAATTTLLAPQQDGVVIWLNEKDKYPQFELEDYWIHEAKTGISLTIETAAVFLDVSKKYENEDMWDKALNTFFRKALPTIVRSEFFFTRNTVARHFFQQIHLERVMCDYRWEESETNDWKDENYWDALIERAMAHVGILRWTPEEIIVQDEQIEESLKHIGKLIDAVIEPVNIKETISDSKQGLAMFCNKGHKYVKFFTDRLDTTKNDEIRLNKKSKLSLFAKIRKAVLNAIAFGEKVQKVGLREDIDVFLIQDEIPKGVWESYSAFANTKGGTILLMRDLWEKHSDILDPKKKCQMTWKKSALNVVEDFWKQVNDLQYTCKNILDDDSIHIWEVDNKEYIEIIVPKAKPDDGIICIGNDPQPGIFRRMHFCNVLCAEQDIKRKKKK